MVSTGTDGGHGPGGERRGRNRMLIGVPVVVGLCAVVGFVVAQIAHDRTTAGATVARVSSGGTTATSPAAPLIVLSPLPSAPGASSSTAAPPTTTAAHTTTAAAPAAAPSTTGVAAAPAATTPADPPLTAGVYSFNRQIYSGSGLLVVLTTVTVDANGPVTAVVVYRNTTTSTTLLSCQSVGDPGIDRLTRDDGAVSAASESYCSLNPSALITLTAGQTFTSFASFSGVAGQGSSFTLTWQAGENVTGTVAGLTL